MVAEEYLWVTHVTKMSIPHSGHMIVSLACVFNVKLGATRGILTTTRISRSAHIHSLAGSRLSHVHVRISGLGIRNSLHHRMGLGVGQLVRVKSCEKVHRHHNLPIHKRGAGGGTHAHGNPTGSVTNGGGWWLDRKNRGFVTGGMTHGHHMGGGIRTNMTRVHSAFGGAVIVVASIRKGTVS